MMNYPGRIEFLTRMHSSRMRTARTVTMGGVVRGGCGPGGVIWGGVIPGGFGPGGVWSQGGVVLGGVIWGVVPGGCGGPGGWSQGEWSRGGGPGGVSWGGCVPCDISHHAFDVTCLLPPHQLRHINSAPAYILLPGHVTCKACWDTHPPRGQTHTCKNITFANYVCGR